MRRSNRKRKAPARLEDAHAPPPPAPVADQMQAPAPQAPTLEPPAHAAVQAPPPPAPGPVADQLQAPGPPAQAAVQAPPAHGADQLQAAAPQAPAPEANVLGNILLPEILTVPTIPSIRAELGLAVPQAIRDKIKQGQFIELGTLLPNANPGLESGAKLTWSVNDMGQLSMAQSNPKKITSIEEWSDAFLIYASIYLAEHPLETQAILKYFSVIRCAAKRHVGLGWQSYDRQFRLRVAANPNDISFKDVDQELWLFCMGPSALSSGLGGDRKCYDFNLRSCTRGVCNYRHCCLNCSGNHPAQSCWRAPQYSPRAGRATFTQPRQPLYRSQPRLTFRPRAPFTRPRP